MCFVDVGLAMLVIALILCGSGLIPSEGDSLSLYVTFLNKGMDLDTIVCSYASGLAERMGDDVRGIKDKSDLTIAKDRCRRDARRAIEAVVQPLDDHLTLIENVINKEGGTAAVLMGNRQGHAGRNILDLGAISQFETKIDNWQETAPDLHHIAARAQHLDIPLLQRQRFHPCAAGFLVQHQYRRVAV